LEVLSMMRMSKPIKIPMFEVEASFSSKTLITSKSPKQLHSIISESMDKKRILKSDIQKIESEINLIEKQLKDTAKIHKVSQSTIPDSQRSSWKCKQEINKKMRSSMVSSTS
jgi:septal ring factor EnvC (AmiA/AmiB activator)